MNESKNEEKMCINKLTANKNETKVTIERTNERKKNDVRKKERKNATQKVFASNDNDKWQTYSKFHDHSFFFFFHSVNNFSLVFISFHFS